MLKYPGLVLALMVLVFSLALVGGCVPLGATPTPTNQETGISSILPLIIFLILIFGMFYFLIMRPQRRRQREQQQLMSQLKRGDKVVTAGGIYGVIESVSEDSVVLKVESGALIRVSRGSILGKRE